MAPSRQADAQANPPAPESTNTAGEELASYIRDMLREMEVLARGQGLVRLGDELRRAKEEADRVARPAGGRAGMNPVR